MPIIPVDHNQQNWKPQEAPPKQEEWDLELKKQNEKKSEPPESPEEPSSEFPPEINIPATNPAWRLAGPPEIIIYREQELIDDVPLPPLDPADYKEIDADGLTKPYTAFKNIWEYWGYLEQRGIIQGAIGVNNFDPGYWLNGGGDDTRIRSLIGEDGLKFIKDNQYMLKNLDENGNGRITKTELRNFLVKYQGDIKKANEAYKNFLTKNPNADNATKEIARNASLLAANRSLMTNGENFTIADVRNLANNTSSYISEEVKEAAKFFSQPGAFASIEIAGDNDNNPILSTRDGIATVGNIYTWMDKNAPKNPQQLAAFLQDVAFYNISDRQKLDDLQRIFGPDGKLRTNDKGEVVDQNGNVISNEKLANALRELEELKGEIEFASASGLIAAERQGLHYDNKLTYQQNAQIWINEINDKIAGITNRPGMKEFLSNEVQKELKTIVDSDPDLAREINNLLTSFGNGGGGELNPYNATKDAPLHIRLTNLAAALDVFHAAVGKSGASLEPYLSQAMRDEIDKYITDEIASGKFLGEMIKESGGNVELSMNIFRGIVANLEQFRPATISANLQAIGESIVKEYQKYGMETTTAAEILTLLGDSQGNLDEAKAASLYNQIKDLNPNAFKLSDGSELTVEDFTRGLRAGWDAFRNGQKISDALIKIDAELEKAGRTVNGQRSPVSAAYKAGYLHIISGVLGSIGPATRWLNGKAPNSQDIVKGVAVHIAALGTFAEGIAKLRGSNVGPQFKDLVDRLKNIENVAKIFGGLGGLVNSAFGFLDFAKYLADGKPVNAAFSFTSGALGTISSGASVAEGVANLLATNANFARFLHLGKLSLARMAMFAGAAGWVTTVISGGLMLGLAIYEAIVYQNTLDGIGNKMRSKMQKYGIQGMS